MKIERRGYSEHFLFGYQCIGEVLLPKNRIRIRRNAYSIRSVVNRSQQLSCRYGPNISLKTLDALQCSYPIFLRNVTVVSLDLTLIKVVEVVEKENIKTINSEQA